VIVQIQSYKMPLNNEHIDYFNHSNEILWKGKLVCENPKILMPLPEQDNIVNFKTRYRFNSRKPWKECIEKVYYFKKEM